MNETLIKTLMKHYYVVYDRLYQSYMRGDLMWYEYDAAWSAIDNYRHRKVMALRY